MCPKKIRLASTEAFYKALSIRESCASHRLRVLKKCCKCMLYNVNEKILDREKEKEIDWNPLHVYDVKSRKK